MVRQNKFQQRAAYPVGFSSAFIWLCTRGTQSMRAQPNKTWTIKSPVSAVNSQRATSHCRKRREGWDWQSTLEAMSSPAYEAASASLVIVFDPSARPLHPPHLTTGTDRP